jgi:hypothetical protein
MVTSICGSSSRGVISTATRPSSRPSRSPAPASADWPGRRGEAAGNAQAAGVAQSCASPPPCAARPAPAAPRPDRRRPGSPAFRPASTSTRRRGAGRAAPGAATGRSSPSTYTAVTSPRWTRRRRAPAGARPRRHGNATLAVMPGADRSRASGRSTRTADAVGRRVGIREHRHLVGLDARPSPSSDLRRPCVADRAGVRLRHHRPGRAGDPSAAPTSAAALGARSRRARPALR